VILPKGWVCLDELQSPNRDSNFGFIAMWFDSSTQALRDRLSAAVRNAGFQPFIIDQHPTNEDIMDEVLAAIRRCRFVVADFTGNRHNVYYEAGFAQGQHTPVIRTCRKGVIKEVTFDVNHYPFILWEPSSLDTFQKQLQNHIEATIGLGLLKGSPAAAVSHAV
jgi:nucleoside 2-deoxyribosyltransferase